ncbi:hypothetical protein [uncultured Agrobacterium sp.]|nr:hypothetical protein [uncultured Agrobacterium sp.]
MPSSVSVSLCSAGAGVLAVGWAEELWLVGVDDDGASLFAGPDVPVAD